MKPLGFRIAVRNVATHARSLALGALILAAGLHVASAVAQQVLPPRPGEAFVTRFSGTASTAEQGGAPVTALDPEGVVGSVIDLRAPNQPPQGQHWIAEPQRLFVTAAEVGQVFGIALDDGASPNVFLAATSAFGLHRTPDNGQWQSGMWGSGGGPGTIYRLGPSTNYRPQPFAHLTLGGRPNTGAALGNIAYDRWNRQLYVSDLETGMIHRLRAEDGANLGFYDHGVRGRSGFLDASEGQEAKLPPVSFDPSTQARIADCPAAFDNAPECWNLAPNGRRVWGVGVWRNGSDGEVRLYYATWSSPAFDPEGWLELDDADKRNAVWSVGINDDGSFNVGSVRREFLLPDFFVNTADISRAGFSQPVSDIAFPVSPGMPLMLVAERGGLRNLGLGEPNAFATPHESRVIRYELHQDGVWRPIGRYEIGFYDRANEGDPRMRANGAGGASFGPGFNTRWNADQNRPDNYVWISGDALCSPFAPCNLTGSGQETGDNSEVHGLQGLREDFYDEVAPAVAYGLAPEQQLASGQTTAVGPDEAYLIDLDLNLSPSSTPLVDEFVRNDATQVGDVAVFQRFIARPAGVSYPLPPPPPVVVADPGHDPNYSHARYGSHGQQQSHYRFASHWPAMSHHRFGSHNQYWSHYRYASHNLKWSHNRFGSHSAKETHNKLGSHQAVKSHFAKASKIHLLASSHKKFGSHSIKESLNDKIKIPEPKPVHTVAKSIADKLKIPDPKPVHTLAKSAADKGVKLPGPKHSVVKSALDKDIKVAPVPVHTVAKSAAEKGLKLPVPVPVHTVAKSAFDKDVKGPAPKHNPVQSAVQNGKVKVPAHSPANSGKASPKLPPKIQPKAPPKVEPKLPPKIQPKTPPKVEPKLPPKIEPKAPPKAKPKLPPKIEPKAKPKAPTRVEPRLPPKAQPKPAPNKSPGQIQKPQLQLQKVKPVQQQPKQNPVLRLRPPSKQDTESRENAEPAK